MKKIVHTKISTGEKTESQMELSAWENHIYFNNPEYSNVVTDITEYLRLKDEDLISEQLIKIGLRALQRIGTINRTKSAGIALELLQAPETSLIASALLVGDPLGAKTLIVNYSDELYSQGEKDQVIAILDEALIILA